MEHKAYLRAGYARKLINKHNGEHSWYRGYVHVPVWHPIFPILPDYETITMMINSPIELTYADHLGVGFDIYQEPNMSHLSLLVRATKCLNDLYQRLVDYELSEDN